MEVSHVLRRHLLVLSLYLLLSLLFLNPLSLHLADALTDAVDPLLNTWILAWDQHALVTSPSHLFQANIFAPYGDALAYSENLLGSALLTLPVALAVGIPVLSHNLTLLLGFTLGGYCAYLLGRQVVEKESAAILVGVIFAFNAYRLSMLPKAQMATMQWFPLVLLTLWRVARGGRLRDAALLAVLVILQALSSITYAIYIATVLILLAPLFILSRRPHLLRRLLAVALGGGLALIALVPIALPYLRLSQRIGLQRVPADAIPFAASLRQWLLIAPAQRLYGRFLSLSQPPMVGPYPVDFLFPGFLVLLLALAGLIAFRRKGLWWTTAIFLALAGFVMSLGPVLQVEPLQPVSNGIALPYRWLYDVVPGFSAVRAPARFAGVAMLGLALLAGMGLREMQQRGAGRGVATILIGVAFLEAFAWPATSLTAVPPPAQLSPVYGWLQTQPPGRVVELPAALPQQRRMAERWLWPQYGSIAHWRETPLGYSGFVPPRHEALVDLLNRFPDDATLRLLRALDVHYVILQRAYYDAEVWGRMTARVAAEEGLQWVWEGEEVSVVEVSGEETLAHVSGATLSIPPSTATGEPFAPLLSLDVVDGEVFLPGTLARGTIEWHSEGELRQRTAFSQVLPFLVSGKAALLLPSAAPATPGNYQVTVHLQEPLVVEAASPVQVADALPELQPLPILLQGAHFTCQAEAMVVTLRWQALGWLDRPQTVYLHLLNEEGEKVSQMDELLTPAPESWLPGLPVTTTHRLSLPSDLPDGSFSLQVGLYQWSDRFGGIVPTRFFAPDFHLVDSVEALRSSSPFCRNPS